MNLGGVADDYPVQMIALPVPSPWGKTGDVQHLQNLILFDGPVDVDACRTPRDQKLSCFLPSGDQVNIDRIAILRPHRALMQGSGGADGHAMAAVNTKIPRVVDGKGEFLLRDQTSRAGADAIAAGNAEILFDLDDRIHRVGVAHTLVALALGDSLSPTVHPSKVRIRKRRLPVFGEGSDALDTVGMNDRAPVLIHHDRNRLLHWLTLSHLNGTLDRLHGCR